jgi:hypothetical protein
MVDEFVIREGAEFENGERSKIKVMARVGSYVMARRFGCMPFCEHIDTFIGRLMFEGMEPRKTGRTE